MDQLLNRHSRRLMHRLLDLKHLPILVKHVGVSLVESKSHVIFINQLHYVILKRFHLSQLFSQIVLSEFQNIQS